MINPYNQQVQDISLRPQDVQAFVFWSRNYQPFLEKGILEGLAHPFVCHLTITGYPRLLDKATIPAKKAIEQLQHMKKLFGKDHFIWRYDPIVLSQDLTMDWHLKNFENIARLLENCVDEVIVSYLQLYRKTQRNFSKDGFEVIDPSVAEKQKLLGEFYAIARKYGIELTLCAQPDLLCSDIKPAACIDLKRLNRIAGKDLHVRKKPHRKECACVSSKDIGDYNTCPHGCLYCYGVENRALAKQRFQHHDPDSPFLFLPDEEIREKSFQPRLL